MERGAHWGAPFGYRMAGVRKLFFLIGLLTAAWASEPVTVAAASSLRAPLRALAARFESETQTPIRLVLAASGKLALQLKKGAPYDLYLPADPDYLKALREVHQTAPVARGSLVLYLHPRIGLIPNGPEVLLRPEIRRVALANPALAPYGQAAKEVMQRYRVWDAVQEKLVFAESVAQAAGYAAFAADAGWIDLQSAKKLPGRFWRPPPESHRPLVYVAALLRARPEAKAFFDFLQGEEARRLFAEHGYLPP